eukprot:749819-Hanusia_phi.AAC.1
MASSRDGQVWDDLSSSVTTRLRQDGAVQCLAACSERLVCASSEVRRRGKGWRGRGSRRGRGAGGGPEEGCRKQQQHQQE